MGACALGYRDPDVTAAVQRRVGLGSYCLLNSREEIELAELLCELHPWAEQVRFARSGGETMFPCYAHDDAVIDDYVQAMDPVMAELADALSAGDVETRLAGGVVQPGFRRLN